MVTIKEMYEECISSGYPFMAHALYYLLCEGMISPDDSPDAIDSEVLDYNAVSTLEAQNYLGLNVIRPYSLKVTPNEFIFVFAKDKTEAISFIKKKYALMPLNCHEYPLDFSLMRGNAFITFREIKKEFSMFPALIGVHFNE
jgi:hypothetical protein